MERDLLNRYQNIKWERILRTQLGEAGSLEKVRPNLDRAKTFLDKLLDSRVIGNLSLVQIKEIEFKIKRFIDFIDNTILPYTDVNQREIKITEIKNEIGDLLNTLGKYDMYFDVFPSDKDTNSILTKKDFVEINNLKTEVNTLKESILNKSPGIEKAVSIATILLEKKDKVDEAIKKVEEFTKVNEKAIETLLQKNSTSFSQKAQEHIHVSWYSGRIIWLYTSLLFGAFVLGIIGFFIFTNKELTTGAAILRVSAIVAPSYFAVLFANQFLLHKRLYESYKFKDIALQTMILLRKEFVNDHEARGELLQRSMGVIFNEPSIKEENKYDKQMVMELLRMLTNK